MRRSTLVVAISVFVLSYASVIGASAEQSAQPGRSTGSVEGRVLDPQGLGVPGITVVLQGPTLSSQRTVVTEAASGRFRFENLPAGVYDLSAGGVGMYEPTRVSVPVNGDATARIDFRLALRVSEEVTVTEAREGHLKRDTPATVDTVDRAAIAELKPTHPSQVMALVPGAWVNTTSGEGHMTAIRQPLTTNPVYLYLEDGVPIRSTGFFNHNALYEVDIPNADGIEVTKGPGSALYGSDAVAGVVNVLTRPALGPPQVAAETEAGGWGWRRIVAGANVSRGFNGLRADLNLTRSSGWRDSTGYSRESIKVRWDRATVGGAWRTAIAFNHIDQQTAGSSTLSEIDYLFAPTRNLTPISFRKVKALRVSMGYDRAFQQTALSVIPYFRYNDMDLLPNWSLTYDPTVYDTRNRSYGVLAKAHHAFRPWRTDVVGGFDLDVSPGGQIENQIRPGTTTIDGRRIFTSYTEAARIYDYDVTFVGLAPYAQVEISPTSRLRTTAGVRFDRMRYDYHDNLTTLGTARYLRPADALRSYSSVSPKLGVVYQVTDAVNAFASYRRAFRAPSQGQLFRQGSTRDTIDLQPVKGDNLEAGVRARASRAVSFEASLYDLTMHDDIISFADPLDGLTHVVNAGRTTHRGVELGLKLTAASWLRGAVNFAHARHTYDDWLIDPANKIDYSGKEMEIAPRNMGAFVVTLQPRTRTSLSAEVMRLGRYWLDAADTQRYSGHVLANLRGRLALTRELGLFARVTNLTDRRYAETSSYTIQRGRELAPGAPRTGYVGVSVEWSR